MRCKAGSIGGGRGLFLLEKGLLGDDAEFLGEIERLAERYPALTFFRFGIVPDDQDIRILAAVAVFAEDYPHDFLRRALRAGDLRDFLEEELENRFKIRVLAIDQVAVDKGEGHFFRAMALVDQLLFFQKEDEVGQINPMLIDAELGRSEIKKREFAFCLFVHVALL